MSKKLAITIVLIGMLFSISKACKCRFREHKEAFLEADTSIVAKIFHVEFDSSSYQTTYWVNDSIPIKTSMHSQTCGFIADTSKIYVIHLQKKDSIYSTNICMKNFVLKGNESIWEEFRNK